VFVETAKVSLLYGRWKRIGPFVLSTFLLSAPVITLENLSMGFSSWGVNATSVQKTLLTTVLDKFSGPALVSFHGVESYSALKSWTPSIAVTTFFEVWNQSRYVNAIKYKQRLKSILTAQRPELRQERIEEL